MNEEPFSKIADVCRSQGQLAAIEELVQTLEARREFHRLFDALLLKKRFEMGLPLSRPTSFENVPDDRQAEFEEAYLAAARRIGQAFLAEGNIPQAWIYLRTIREPQSVYTALDLLDGNDPLPENIDDLIAVALYERAHPVKGLELMLKSRGTCNTVSAFDQAIPQISAEERVRGAELLVRHIYRELLESVGRDLERRGKPSSAQALRDALAGHDELFEDGNYHVDVSHLGAVVRFARFLGPESPELQKAIELAEYGSKLSQQFQYPSDAPFDAYYAAHWHYFRVLSGAERETSIRYFQDRLESATENDDRRLIAYVLVDLLVRIDALDEAVDLAGKHLADLDESSGFSLPQLCEKAKRLDVFREVARGKGDLVGFTAALLGDGPAKSA